LAFTRQRYGKDACEAERICKVVFEDRALGLDQEAILTNVVSQWPGAQAR
jgi:hypothetical protein